jgi:ABC-type uncharacterized transport system permease subunit
MLGRLGCGDGSLALLFSPLGGLEALILQEQLRGAFEAVFLGLGERVGDVCLFPL